MAFLAAAGLGLLGTAIGSEFSPTIKEGAGSAFDILSGERKDERAANLEERQLNLSAQLRKDELEFQGRQAAARAAEARAEREAERAARAEERKDELENRKQDREDERQRRKQEFDFAREKLRFAGSQNAAQLAAQDQFARTQANAGIVMQARENSLALQRERDRAREREEKQARRHHGGEGHDHHRSDHTDRNGHERNHGAAMAMTPWKPPPPSEYARSVQRSESGGILSQAGKLFDTSDGVLDELAALVTLGGAGKMLKGLRGAKGAGRAVEGAEEAARFGRPEETAFQKLGIVPQREVPHGGLFEAPQRSQVLI